MADKLLPLKDLPLLKKVEVDPNRISEFSSEGSFVSLAVELLKEICVLTAALACAYRLDQTNQPRKWTRNEAILGGLLVRLSKLQHGILDATCNNRREIAEILLRCLTETVINLKYLLQESSSQLFDEYVEYSLREEKRLLMLIDENIKSRGHELPIESRMRKSILRSFEESGVKPEQVDETKKTVWGESIYKKTQLVGMETAYRGLVSLPSHAVHGNWQDLLQHHIQHEGDGFSPKPGWSRSRPQYIFVAALLSAEVCQAYLESLLPVCADKTLLAEQLADCVARVRKADALHEAFVQKRPKATAKVSSTRSSS